jgi:beta-ribofuranosylaminobenzene 5'-phosphate synthase
MDMSRPALEALRADALPAVTLRAPGRLHLGFFDPAGSLGRRFGSLGLVIDGFETEVVLSAAAANRVSAGGVAEQAEAERASAYLQRLQHHSGRHEPMHLMLLRVLPAHAGFGSGTQLALAIARAFAQWHGLVVATPALAQWLGRGARSGIGIAGFDHGGLLVDGGPGGEGVQGASAPLLSRLPLPEAWRVLVVQDSAQRGLSGADEREAIATLAPLPQAFAADICHQVLMRVLPGAACAEFAPFAAGITHIQQVLGGHFAPAQGGSAYTSAAVGRLVEWIAAAGQDAAVGQSSWGPTGFAILPSQAQAEAVVEAARAANVVAPCLTLNIVTGRNRGATVVDSRRAR